MPAAVRWVALSAPVHTSPDKILKSPIIWPDNYKALSMPHIHATIKKKTGQTSRQTQAGIDHSAGTDRCKTGSGAGKCAGAKSNTVRRRSNHDTCINTGTINQQPATSITSRKCKRRPAHVTCTAGRSSWVWRTYSGRLSSLLCHRGFPAHVISGLGSVVQ